MQSPTRLLVYSSTQNKIFMKNNIFLLVLAASLFAACARQAEIPAESTPVNEAADIYPDYRDIVVPPNIAPLNFMVKSEGDEYVAAVTDG